jgi:hypothetical protein
MIPADRRVELVIAVLLVGVRLFFHRDPLDWIVAVGVCWALLCVRSSPAWRNGVLCAGTLVLSGIYLKGQIIHMLAVSNLLP